MNPNLLRFEHMLRSRTRSFGFPSPSEPPDDSILEKSKTRRPSQLFPVFDTRLSTIYKILVLSVTLGAIVFILFWPETTIVLQAASPPASTPIPSFTAAPPARPRLVPLVDRSILQRLADMEVYPDPDEHPYFTSSPQQRPPMVTRIPEARKPLDPFLAPDICSTPGMPCRFLLSLRIGDQESKARAACVRNSSARRASPSPTFSLAYMIPAAPGKGRRTRSSSLSSVSALSDATLVEKIASEDNLAHLRVSLDGAKLTLQIVEVSS
ncbi:hypothetical protein B0H14DRAFT_3877066 [Mycena olivaceomarginata]|nr:hypothetical protein B0H14DRAFT_3877066 [Mycena olivaceomarginata]